MILLRDFIARILESSFCFFEGVYQIGKYKFSMLYCTLITGCIRERDFFMIIKVRVLGKKPVQKDIFSLVKNIYKDYS